MIGHDLIRKLGPIGIWSLEMRFGDKGEAGEAAAEIEELGFSALWMPGGIEGGALGDVDSLLAATKDIVIGVGILNIYKEDPAEIADWWRAQSQHDQGRLLLGLGVSHGPIIGETYGKPLAAMRGYLDRLDAAGMPGDSMCLAALGPKMLELARERTLGSHPYLSTAQHTRMARDVLGPGKLLAPHVCVVLETDPDKARAMAREAMKGYLQLPNYVNNWLRSGFTQADVDTMSDRLVDAVFAWGSMERIAAHIRAHLDAGADHVCLQATQGSFSPDFSAARAAARRLAGALL
jgi:probable F420-dependent oxidoreductase